jgi:hypothetical protein
MLFETNLGKGVTMTRFMFRNVENNFQEGFQPYFLYVLGKSEWGQSEKKNTYSVSGLNQQ